MYTHDTTRSRRTLIEKPNPEWEPLDKQLCHAGQRKAVRYLINTFGNQEENLGALNRFEYTYGPLLEAEAFPHIEDVYLLLLRWHQLNKPSVEQEQLLPHLMPDASDLGNRKDKDYALTILHWHSKFMLHKFRIFQDVAVFVQVSHRVASVATAYGM